MGNKTFKHLFNLIILTLVISYAADKVFFYVLNNISDSVLSGQAIGKLNQFLIVKDTTDVLVFGNSRANHHIAVDQLDNNAFNMGVDGVGIGYSSTLINTLNKNKNQTILVHIDTKNFFDTDYDGSDLRALKTKYKRNTVITSALNEAGQVSILQNMYYLMNYNGSLIGILKNFVKPKYNHLEYNGYDPLVVNSSQELIRDFILNKDNKTSEKCLDNHNINNKALNYLMKIKSYSIDSNKQFIFITSPIHRDLCPLDNEILNRIMHENDLIYWDFTYQYSDSSNNSLWKDKTHMSNLGAEKFTQLLKEKLTEIKN